MNKALVSLLDKRATRVLVAMLAIAAVTPGFIETTRVWRTYLIFPGELDYGEGTTQYEVDSLQSGEDIYEPVNNRRFFATNYPPVYFLLAEALDPLGPESAHFFGVRAASLVGILLTLIACAILVYRTTGSVLAAVFAPVFLYSSARFSLPFIYFGIFGKPDSLAVGLTLCGLALAGPDLKSRSVYVGAIFFVAAIFTKQTTIPAPASVFLAMWFKEDARRALRWIGFCILVSILFLGACMLRFHPQGLIEHIISYNSSQQVDYYEALVGQPGFFVFVFWPLLIAGAFAYYFVRLRWLALYFCISWVLYIPAMGKPGSFVNYWMEPSAVLMLFVAIALGQSLRDVKSPEQNIRPWLSRLVPPLVLLFVWVFCYWLYSPRFQKAPRLPEHVEQIVQFHEELRSIMVDPDQARRPVAVSSRPAQLSPLSDEVDLLVDDPFLYNQLRKAGIIEEDFLLESIEEERLDFILMNYNPAWLPLLQLDPDAYAFHLDRISAEQARAIERHYVVIRKFRIWTEPDKLETLYLYAPASRNR